MNNEYTLDRLLASDEFIQTDPEGNGKILYKSKVILGIMLFLMIGFASLTLSGKGNYNSVDLRTSINAVVDNSLTEISEVNLKSVSTFFNENELNEDIQPVVMELNLVKNEDNNTRINDRMLRDRIIQKISDNVYRSGLNIYPIIDVRFIIPGAQ